MALGGILAGAGIMGGLAGSDGKKYARQALELWEKLKLSDFDMSNLSPPELQMVAEFFPQVYDAQIQGNVQMAQDSPEMRVEQARSLARLGDVADQGLPVVDRLAADEVGRQMSAEQRRGMENVTRGMEARGRLGGGSEFAAQLAQGQQGAEMGSRFGSNIARQAILNRLSAMEAGGQMAGQIRGQDIGLSESRGNAMNRWNEWASNLRTGAAAQNAAARNQAGMYNTGTRQRLADTNNLNRYGTSLENLNRRNDLEAQLFGQRLAKTQGMSGQYSQLGMYQNARQAAKAQAIRGIGQGVDDLGESIGGYYGGGGY